MRSSPLRGLTRLLPVFVLAACGAAGCSGDSGTVSGKVVKADGTVVKGGDISFITKDGHAANADIQENGSYRAEKVPLGDVKITVSTKKYKPVTNAITYQPPPGQNAPNQAGDPEEAKRRYVQIPDDYADLDRTPLSYTVKPGDQTYDPPIK